MIKPIQSQIVKPLTKLEWVFRDDACKSFKDMSFEHKLFNKISVTRQDGDNKLWSIEVRNFLNKLLGREVLAIDKNNKYMFGHSIEVSPEYRKKGLGIGTLLRAFSVMLMRENDIEKMDIFSKNTAVFFHSKFKFEPNENSLLHCKRMLESVINDSSMENNELKSEAVNLLKKIKTLKETDTDLKNDVCRNTNNLVKEFIDQALVVDKPEVKHDFISGFSMTLTKENVDKNKDFYNDIFKQCKLDYKI